MLEYINKYNRVDDKGKKNSFTKLIDLCRDNQEQFGDALIEYESLERDVLFCYLNLSMTSTANVKFKERMTYEKLSDALTIFKEAFAILVFENNFNRWVFLADMEMKKIMSDTSMLNDEDNSNNSEKGNEDTDIMENTNIESIPDVLYQKKVKQRKDKRETAGNWTSDSMERLNELLTKIRSNRNAVGRHNFEEDLQNDYVKYADKNMELINKRKRRQEIEDIEKRNKQRVKVQNVLDIVEL